MQLLSRHARVSAGAVRTQVWPCRDVRHAPTRQVAAHAAGGDTNLAQKRCEPCEASHDALDQMGLAMIMDQATAERFRAQVC